MKPEVHKVTITKGPNQFQRRLEFEKAKREIRSDYRIKISTVVIDIVLVIGTIFYLTLI